AKIGQVDVEDEDIRAICVDQSNGLFGRLRNSDGMAASRQIASDYASECRLVFDDDYFHQRSPAGHLARVKRYDRTPISMACQQSRFPAQRLLNVRLPGPGSASGPLPPAPQGDRAPNQFDDTEWPGALKKTVSRRGQAGGGKSENKRGRSVLESVEE